MIALVLALLAAQPASAKAPAPAPTTPAVAELGRGYAAYRAGDYHAATAALRGAVGKELRNEGLGAVPARARASSTTATTRRRARALREARRARTVAPRRWRRSGSPTACGWRATAPRPPPATRGWSRPPRRARGTPRWRGSASPSRRPSAIATLPASSSWPSRAISRPIRWPTRRCADSAPARPRRPRRRPDAADAADHAATRRLRRTWRPPTGCARGVAVEGPPLGRSARGARQAAGDAAARAGRRARLPDRHDEVPHAPRLRGRRLAAAGRGRPPVGRQGGVGAVPWRARAVARRSRRRGDRRLPQGDREVAAVALGGRSAVPVGLARLQPRPLQGEPPGVPGDARQIRQQRVRRRRRLVPRVRALPARQRRRGGRRLRSLRAPAAHRHRLRRDRRCACSTGAHGSTTRPARRTKRRPATASSPSAPRSRSTVCWRARG